MILTRGHMEPIAWALVSVLVVSAISLIGAASLSFGALRHHRVIMALVAVAAGTLLGDAFLHLLPEASHDGFTSTIGGYVLGGFLVMFGIEVVLRRQHSHAEHIDADAHGHVEPFGWLNLVGDAMHNLLDGVIIAAAYLVDIAAGLATTIAVALHEIPQELGDFAVLVRSGMTPAKALMLNLGSAMFALLGAGAVLAIGLSEETIATIAVPLVAGAFIYIAAADLVPELHHHNRGKDLAVILTALLVGITIMFLLLGLESALPGDPHDH